MYCWVSQSKQTVTIIKTLEKLQQVSTENNVLKRVSRRKESSSVSEEGQIRAQKKEQTRQALLLAALRLIGEGSSFTALGIREITREAGVVPTAFYRHFRNTDELGLALVEESGITLRRMLREARQAGIASRDMIRLSVRVYVEYLRQNHLQFRFVVSERAGGSRALRMAVRNEINHFANEMAADLRALGAFENMSTISLQMICGLVVTTMLAAATDILDIPGHQPRIEQEMIDNFVKQLIIIFLGATRWVDDPRGRRFTRLETKHE